MASGLPIVASRSGGIPDLIHNGENGLLVEPGNVEELAGAIRKMISMEDLRNVVCANGMERIQNFTYTSVGKKYIKLLENLIR